MSNRVERPAPDYVFCSTCKNKVALVDDLIKSARFGGIFNGVYNVEEDNHHETILACTVASIYCDQCRTHLGGKLITVPQPDNYIREGRYLMKLRNLSYWNDEPLCRLDEEQDLGTNEENADQDGEVTDQDGDTTDQDGDVNDENTGEDGDTSEEDFDANKENIDPNVQIADQDGDANDENTDEDGDATDEDGRRN